MELTAEEKASLAQMGWTGVLVIKVTEDKYVKDKYNRLLQCDGWRGWLHHDGDTVSIRWHDGLRDGFPDHLRTG